MFPPEGDELTVKEGGKIVVRIDADIKELIPGFLQGRRDDVDAICAALNAGDYETVGMLGHTMKGTGGGYGFQGIMDIGRLLEQAAHDKNDAEIKKMAGELCEYLKKIEIVFEVMS